MKEGLGVTRAVEATPLIRSPVREWEDAFRGNVIAIGDMGFSSIIIDRLEPHLLDRVSAEHELHADYQEKETGQSEAWEE